MTTISSGSTGTFTFVGADSVLLTLDQGEQARVSVVSPAGLSKYSSTTSVSQSMGPFATGDVLSITAMRGDVDYSVVPNGSQVLTAAYTLSASDDQKEFWCNTALTISIPDKLSPRPVCTFVPPPTGNLTIAMLGVETLNGALTPLTRTRSNNVGGVVLQGYRDAAAYGLSGT